MYTEDEVNLIFDEICGSIINGKSLRYAIKQHDGLSSSTFFKWIREDEFKSKQYAQATIERADLMFEEMMDIADEAPERMATKTGDCVDSGSVQNKRVRIDTRKWALSKMMPKKYGDKLDLTTNGDNLNKDAPQINLQIDSKDIKLR